MESLFLKESLAFAKKHNALWPFGAVIVNAKGQIICSACDCAHLSPLFHAETLALHVLSKARGAMDLGPLTMYCTAEPDVMSQSAIYWANICKKMNITDVYYGAPLESIQNLWPYGIDIPSREIIARSRFPELSIHGPCIELECTEAFERAKQLQEQSDHVLSDQESDFYILNREFF